MWTKRKEENDESEFHSPAPDSGASMEAGSEAALETDDVFFPHPGGYGIMMMPLRVIKAGFFGGRRRKRRAISVYAKGGDDTGDHRDASSARQTKLPREQQDPVQQHSLCRGDPARVDEILEEAHGARMAEQALRKEAVRLVAIKAGLEEDVRSLHKNKELMTEAHRAQLERLQQELEADARESRRRLKAELEKGHENSLNSLRKTLGSETERLAGETKRLREDLAHARQAPTSSKSSRSSSSTAGASKPPSGPRTSGNINGDSDPPPFPEIARFWKSFKDIFGSSGTPHEFLTSTSAGVMDGITADPVAALAVAPPALFVLVTVPLFCLLSKRRRQRMLADNRGAGNNGDEIEAADVEEKSGKSSAGFDGTEGEDENRPPTEDGQEVEVARSVGEVSPAGNPQVLPSQHARSSPEVLISPSAVAASRTPLRRRSRQQDSPVSADGVGSGTLAVSAGFVLEAREVESAEVRAREDRSISMGRRPSSSSLSSTSPSPERSTPATKTRQEQQQEREKSLLSRPVVRPPIKRPAAERQSPLLPPALAGEEDRGDGSIAREKCWPPLTQSPVSRGRSLSTAERGPRFLRGALESLRRERDSLASTCHRLEAEREVVSMRFRENAERVMQLEKAGDVLEKEKSCLMERCAGLEKEMEACGKEAGCTEASMDTDSRVMELGNRVSEMERERDETAALAAEKEARLASLTVKVEELQEALAATSATAAAAAADSTHFFSAAAALATAETQAAGRAADATQALASKEEEAEELRRRARRVEEEKQMVENNLRIAEAEKESCEKLARELQGRIADQEIELKQLMLELEKERKATSAATAAAVSSSESSCERALSESHSKLAALDSASARAAADLEEANCQLQRLQVENAEQQALFESKVSDLAAAACKISRLENSATRYLARQRELEDETKGLREETERLEAARDELQAEAIAKEEERASELDHLRRQAADLSSKLESSGIDKEVAEGEVRRVRREMETRCCELELEKQAQAAEYEQRLNERFAELEANALAKEAAGREREELEASHAEQFQVLLEKNASFFSEVEAARGLLGERTQELAALGAKAASNAVESKRLLSAAEIELSEERRRGNAAAAALSLEVADAAAVAEARGAAAERKAEEADALQREVSRLSSELQALSLAKDAAASEASVALEEKAKLLADAEGRQRRLKGKVEQGTDAAAELERQVAVGKKRIEELAGELEAERSSVAKAAEKSAAEIAKLREQMCFKESQMNAQKSWEESSNGRADEIKQELDEKILTLARAEERVLVLEAEREEIAYMIKDIRNEKEKYVAELKRKREKTAAELKDTRAAQREAEKRCRELEEENEAMTDDYEGRLQQQALNYEERIAKAQGGGARVEAEVERLQLHIHEIEESRKLTAGKLREIMKKYSENEERFLAALDKERERADRLDRMLEDSRKERDADWERLHQNMDSLKEQLDVKSSTVKYLWEKVAATRREKGVGNEELKAKLDEANEVRANLEHLVEEQEEQLERLRRRAKRRDEEITQTVMARLEAHGGEGGFTTDCGTSDDCSLADIKAERKKLVRKCQVLEQQVSDLKKLVDEITKLEHGAPETAGDASLEVLSVCSDMSQESSFTPKTVEDIPEAELRELVSWFRARGGERRRLLKRYRAGRLKTEALAAKKKAGVDPFASARGRKLPLKRASGRSPNSDAGSVKSVHSARSGITVASNLSLRMANADGVEDSSRRGKNPRPRDRSLSPRPPNEGVGTGRGAEARTNVSAGSRNRFSRPTARSDLSASGNSGGGSKLKPPTANRRSPRATTRAA